MIEQLCMKTRKPKRWFLFIMTMMTVITMLAVSSEVEAGDDIPVCVDDTDGDGIHDCIDTDPLTGSHTFANSVPIVAGVGGVGVYCPDICKTPAVNGAVPTPYPYSLRYGLRNVLSDFGDPTQGPLGNSPRAVATDASGEIFVLAHTALYHVDRTNGFRTELSDFADTNQGPIIGSPRRLAVDDSGMILVTDTFGGPSASGFLFKIDPLSGVRTVLSDFADTNQGQLSRFPSGVTVEASGSILVTDLSGLLFRIDSGSGARTILSDFSDAQQGPVVAVASGVAVDRVGTGSPRILATSTSGFVLSVDPVSGSRSVISDTSDPTQQALGVAPIAVAVEDSGGILVVDPGFVGTDLRGALVFVDPSTGIRQFLSDFGFSPQGPLGSTPLGVAVGASGVVYVTDPDAGFLFEITLHETTSGTVGTKGDQNVKVTQTDPDHVAVITDDIGGADPAAIIIPGGSVVSTPISGATMFMSASDSVTVSRGSVVINVVSGPVEIQFFGDSGIEANTTLGSGNSLSFDPTTLTFETPSTNTDPVVILIDGIHLTLQPDETITFANVEIDIKPNSDPNCFNNNGHGVIPVAILSRVDFDATQVDPLTVQLDGQDVQVVGKKGNVQSHAEDVNSDGLADLVLQITDEDGTYQEGDAVAILTGATFDGAPIQGTDSICIVP